MSLRTRKKRKIGKNSGPESETKAGRILRIVGNEEAFYFYESIGKPTGQSARSLSDFLEKTKFVSMESLQFHLQRKDFQNWIEKTLGDSELAGRMGRIRPSHNEDLRLRIRTTIENRMAELQAAPLTLLANEGLAVASSHST
jgi:hypothetical protein